MSQNQRQPPQIFGFSGKLGVGKNYVAEELFYGSLPSNTMIMAFADHFKVDCVSKDDVDFEKVFVKKDEHTRRLLQLRGTEEGRDKYGDDIWIRTIETWIQLYYQRGIDYFIITDVRFPNEAAWVRSVEGKTFRINAPNRNNKALNEESNGNPEMLQSIATHVSETALDYYTEFDYVINNDYGEESNVKEKIQSIIKKLKIRK
jgi:phosphomevalonate kinase